MVPLLCLLCVLWVWAVLSSPLVCPWSLVSLLLVPGSSLWCVCCACVSACVFAGVSSLAVVGHFGCGGVSVRLSWFGGGLFPSPASCCLPPPCGWSPVAFPPVVGPLWRPGPVSVLVPPSGYLVAFVTARLPCLCLGCGGALSSSLHLVSWQQRPLALCGVCITLYTMVHVLLWCLVLLH